MPLKHKIGDTVTIRKDLKIGEKHNYFNVSSEMCNYKGETATIRDVYIYSHKYKLDIDDGLWNWTDEMFEEEVKEKISIKKEFKTGDKVKIINGVFKGIEGSVISIETERKHGFIIGGRAKVLLYPYLKSIGYMLLIEVDKSNIIKVNFEDVEIIKPKVIKKEYNNIFFDKYNKYDCTIKIRGRRTTVILNSYDIKASVYCHNEDTYNEVEGSKLAFKKALAKKYQMDFEKACEDK